MALSTDLPTPAPGQNGPAIKAKQRKPPIVRFPIQLRVHITSAMNASLARISKRMLTPEGVIGRWALIQYLSQQDRDYHED